MDEYYKCRRCVYQKKKKAGLNCPPASLFLGFLSRVDFMRFCRKIESGHWQPCRFWSDILLFRGGSSMASKERFHGGHFPKRIVLQAVFWYLRYSLSYRDIEELMRERGVEIDHATVQRWVVKYTPILEAEFRKRKKTVGTSKSKMGCIQDSWRIAPAWALSFRTNRFQLYSTTFTKGTAPQSQVDCPQ